MLQIGICDDMSDVRMKLRALLERLLEAQSIQCRIFEFSSGEGLLGWYEKHSGELDLIFLDIEMGEMNGMEAAKALRQQDESLQLVFVTGYTDYVFDGYAVGALGYLIKPPKSGQLEDVLTRALSSIHRQEPELFFCKNGDSYYRIRKDAILYFQSAGRQVTCVTKEHSYLFYAKLDEVAQQIGEGFVRIHQRYLVRAAAVERIDSVGVTANGQTLPVSRAYSQAALLALARAAFL